MSLREILTFTVCVFALVFSSGCGGSSSSTAAPPEFRTIITSPDINETRVNPDSEVINSSAELNAFVVATETATVNSGVGEGTPSDAFVKALRAANVNFDQEALVLLRQTTPDGTSDVALDSPKVEGTTFMATLQRRPKGGGIGGAGMSGTCIVAVAVSRARVDDVQVTVLSSPNRDGTPKIIRLPIPNRP